MANSPITVTGSVAADASAQAGALNRLPQFEPRQSRYAYVPPVLLPADPGRERYDGEEVAPVKLVAQEPVWDLYRYLYMNGVRYSNSLVTPALYDAIAGSPGPAGDGLAYNFNSVNDTSKPGCPAQNYAEQLPTEGDAAMIDSTDNPVFSGSGAPAGATRRKKLIVGLSVVPGVDQGTRPVLPDGSGVRACFRAVRWSLRSKQRVDERCDR